MTNMIDSTGHRVSGATPRSLELFEKAAQELLCMVDDPVATVTAAMQAAPEMPMAHVLNAWLNLLGTEPSGIGPASDSLDAAARFDADERERAHIAAARALANGHWQEAGLRLEDLSARFPRDALALQVGHQIDFFRGDSRMLRDRIARALPAWSVDMPGWHAILGMYAFGLEETADYETAEAMGRRAVEIESRDSWAWHAVAHVHEMRNAPTQGIAWLAPARADWSNGSFLATHNSWHLALFHLELEQVDEALRIYDEAIAGAGSALMLDLVDASAMLWRLHLRGVAIGDRFDTIADRWAQASVAGQYAFNDLHAMIAFVGADRSKQQQSVIEAMEAATRGIDASAADNATFTSVVGLPASLAIQAFGDGDFARATSLLRSIRSVANRFGGSHAQRDLIDQTLIESARRSGDRPLAEALAAERVALRPRSRLALNLAGKARAPVAA